MDVDSDSSVSSATQIEDHQNNVYDFDEHSFGGESNDESDKSDFSYKNSYAMKYGIDDCTNYDENYEKYHIEKYGNDNGNKSLVIENDEAHDLLEETCPDKNDEPNKIKEEIDNHDGSTEEDIAKLESFVTNDLNILPKDWIEATHKSGMPIYMHKPSRVISLSRPYFLGSGDPKSHLAPLCAISCLHYKKSLESQEIIKNDPKLSGSASIVITQDPLKRSLTHKQLREHCQPLFKFKKKQFPNKRCKFSNVSLENTSGISKTAEEIPSFPSNELMLTAPNEEHYKNITRFPKWTLDLNNKNYVSILQQYVSRVLKLKYPEFVFEKIEKDKVQYFTATVKLDDKSYGVGFGAKKKQAKMNAAKATLDIFIPELKNMNDVDHQEPKNSSVLDQLKVSDQWINKVRSKYSESPYSILRLCLQRNFGVSKIEFDYEVITYGKCKCKMTFREHTVSALGESKYDCKQKASQMILALLHPNIENWSMLLKIYGKHSIKSTQEKKKEAQELYQLQKKCNEPNYAVLNKLQLEMLKVREQRKLNELHKPMFATKCPFNSTALSAPNTNTTGMAHSKQG